MRACLRQTPRSESQSPRSRKWRKRARDEFPAGYRRESSGCHPPYDHAAYASTHKRAPRHAPVRLEHTLSEITGPRFAREMLAPGENDLTHFNGGEALGERIIVTGRVLDEDGRAIPHTVIEIWQANAAGRYAHAEDQHEAPLDPHFAGIGRVITDEHGAYRFMTVKPGAYPWRNHHNAWRPESYSLQPFRSEFRHSPDYSDVFSRRSAFGS